MTLKQEYYFLGIVILLFVVASLISLNDYLLYTPDCARYIAWANSLARYGEFVDTTTPDPIKYVVHAPLLSLVMAPIAYFFPNSIIACKVTNIILAVISFIVLYKILRLITSSYILALLITVIFILNPLSIIFSTQVLSEILFSTGLITLFFCYYKFNSAEVIPNYYSSLMIFSVIVCVFSREVGILLVPLSAYFLLKKKGFLTALISILLPVMLYMLWFLRNEIVIAGIEHPPLRNSQLFLSNVLNSKDNSFLSEMVLRWQAGFEFYFKQLLTLVFLPMYQTISNPYANPMFFFVDHTSPVYRITAGIVEYSYWIFILCSSTLVIAGLYFDFRKNKFRSMPLQFIIIYFVLILSYPVIDIRFLYPVLVVIMIWLGYALIEIDRFKKNVFKYVLGLLMIFMLPNFIWVWNFVVTQNNVRNDPLREERTVDGNDSSLRLTSPLSLVGKWITDQQDSSKVILSRYKELAFYCPDKRVYVLDVFTPLEKFENYIRDYEIRFIVSSADEFQWQEFEIQMTLTSNYTIKKIKNFGPTSVYEVTRVPIRYNAVGKFSDLIYDVFKGNFNNAEIYFNQNRTAVMQHPQIAFLAMMNKQSLGQLDSAKFIINNFYQVAQGLALSMYGGLHKTIIDRRMKYRNTVDKIEKADLLMTIGLNYWEVDMRSLARVFAKECIKQDSSYVLAYVYNVIFSLEENDISSAEYFLGQLKKYFPADSITAVTNEIVELHQKIQIAHPALEKTSLLIRLANLYVNINMPDRSLSVLEFALRILPNNVDVLLQEAKLYDKLHRSFSSYLRYNALIDKIPNSDIIKSKVIAFQMKLYL